MPVEGTGPNSRPLWEMFIVLKGIVMVSSFLMFMILSFLPLYGMFIVLSFSAMLHDILIDW